MDGVTITRTQGGEKGEIGMSEKRKDSKGRLLRTGEQQRKDGRYIFGYKDVQTGKTKYVYSWKLEKTDKLPAGVRDCVSLREKEKEIEKALADSVAYHGGDMSVLQLVEKYVGLKTGVKENTRVGYQYVINILKKEEFATRRIDTIKISDAKEFLIKLQQDGRSYSTVHTVRGVVRPAFQMAVDDDLIGKNPFQFELKTVIVNDSVTRDALTHDQKRKFLEFIKNDKHYCIYYDAVYILFHTGLRISEFCALTIRDIDLKNKKILVTKQLQRTRDMRYVIDETKTDAGYRTIPVSDDVIQCFKNIIDNRPKPKVEPMIGSSIGFLFLDKNNMPMVALHWEHYFKRMVNKYNSIYKVQMPPITPHVCRHTYCSHCAGAGMNPKTLQYLMGHADISVTLNTYTHVDMNNVVEDVKKLSVANV